MSRITDMSLQPNIVYTKQGFLVRVKVQDDYFYKKYLISENLHYKTIQGTSFTITNANSMQQAEITEIRGKGEKRKLPSEYQEVEYIEATGTQWINTLYSMLEQNVWKLETKVNLTANSLAIMGYALVTDTSNEVWIDGQSYIIARFLPEVNRVVIKKLSLNTDYTITFDNNSSNFVVTINDETFTYNRIEPRQRTNAPIGFGHRQGGSYLKGKIYSLKMWSDTLERNFIPCYRVIDNVVGMYDIVTNTFYENAGTDAFGKGADIIYNNVTGDNEIVVSNKNLFDINNAIDRPSWNNKICDRTITDANNFTLKSNATDDWCGIYLDNLKTTENYTIKFTATLLEGAEGNSLYVGIADANSPRTAIYTNTPKEVEYSFTNSSKIYIKIISQARVQFSNVELVIGTPNNYIPHEINSYKVELGGKNLLNIKDNLRNSPSNGITTVYNTDNSITISGTTTGTWSNLMNNTSVVLGAGTYTLSINEAMPFNVYLNVLYNDGTSQNPSITRGNTRVTWTTDKVITRYRLDTSGMTNNTVYDKTFYVQLETGSQATPFSPYTSTPIELSENDKLWNNNGTWQLNDTAITDNYLLTQLQALENIELYENLCYVDWVGNVKADMSLQYAGTEDLGTKFIITNDGKRIRSEWRRIGEKNG